MARPLNVGVIGCGYWGPNLARNFDSLPDSKLVAVCDLDPGRLDHMRRLYPNARMYQDHLALIRDPQIDAVVVATGVGTHFSICRESLLAGKHVCVEKPMATRASECSDLDLLARQRGLTLMVGHTFLYSPVVRRIKEIISRGEIGDIRYISARRLNLGLFRKDINVTWDLAPHDLSIIEYMLGEMPVSVNCRGSANVTPGTFDVSTLWLTFSGNRSATVHSSWLDPRKTREMTIVGSKKMIVYDDVALQDKIRIFDARVETPPHYDTFAEFHFAYHYGDIHIPHVRQEEPLKVECQHFIDCVRSGAEPLSAARHAKDLVRILEAADESARKNGVAVFLNEGARDSVGGAKGSCGDSRLFEQAMARPTEACDATEPDCAALGIQPPSTGGKPIA